MKVKTTQGLSKFCIDLIVLGIAIPILVISIFSLKFLGTTFSLAGFLFLFGAIFGAIFIFFKLLFIHENIKEFVIFKYKIVESQYKTLTSYRALALRPWFFFLIWWQPVSDNTSSYELQNIFGATHTSYISYEKIFYKEAEAEQSIKNHKRAAKEYRKQYFERPEKETITTINV